jgi:diguanylate cyclase (GGDEF)-like protein/PAS domain S-box-containing protein
VAKANFDFSTAMEFNALLQEREYLLDELKRSQDVIERLESKIEDISQRNGLLSERGDHTTAYLLNNLIKKSPLPTVLIRPNGIIVQSNESFDRCFDLKAGVQTSVKSVVVAEDTSLVNEWLAGLSADQFPVLSNIKLKDQVGLFSFVPSVHDMVKGLLLLNVVPDDLMSLEPIMSLSRAALEQINEGIWIANQHHQVIYVNQAYTEISGYGLNDLSSRLPQELFSLHDVALNEEIWCSLKSNGFWRGEVRGYRKSGEYYSEWLNISKVNDTVRGEEYYVVVSSDVSDKQRQQSKLDRLAHFDSLTGLANRNLFSVVAEKMLAKAHRNKEDVALLFIDLDHFKYINDHYGHDEGDQVLKVAALRIVSALRDSDLISRQGGDEFVVLLDVTNQKAACDVSNKLNKVLSEPYPVNGNVHRISASIGIALSPKDGLELKDLLRRADTAMYLAKESGRGRSSQFDELLEQKSWDKKQTETLIWNAIENDQLILNYQPVFDFGTGSSKEFEVLVRIQSSTGKLVQPDEFIPVAEHSGLVCAITKKVIEKTVFEVGTLMREGDCKFRINFSAMDFTSSESLDYLDELVREHQISPSSIGIEVTESAIIHSVSEVKSLLVRARQMGYSILMDDFGVGYASFSNIRDLPFTHVKIDQSFVSGKESSSSGQALIKAVVDLASYYGFKVVAEGVQSDKDLVMVKHLGCDACQGYALAKPMLYSELAKWVLQLGSESRH